MTNQLFTKLSLAVKLGVPEVLRTSRFDAYVDLIYRNDHQIRIALYESQKEKLEEGIL